MFSFKSEFPEWEDFPKGLRVLIVDEDEASASETRRLLEECHYHGVTYTNGEKALAAVQHDPSAFHVALVEAMMTNGVDAFKLLEAARHLPVMLMSSTDNMSLMMQGIAMGAADFLQKPLTVDKVRNIWQHVVRKASQEGLRLVKPTNVDHHKLPHSPGSPQLPDWLLEKEFTVDQDCLDSLRQSPHRGEVEQEPVVREKVARERPQTRSAPGSPNHQGKRQARLQRCFSERKIDPFQTTYLLHHPMAGSKAGMPPVSSPQIASQSASPPLSSPPQSELTQLTQLQVKTEHEEADTHHSPAGAPLHDLHLPNLSENQQARGSGGHSNAHVTVKVEAEECGGGAVVDADREHQEQLARDLAAEEDLLVSLDQAMDLALESMDGEVHDTDLGLDDSNLLVEVTGGTEDLFGFPPSPTSAGCSPAGDDGADTSVMDNVLKLDDGDKEGEGDGDGEGDGQGGKGGKAASSRRKMKVDWTPELHRRFVQAVEQLGVEKAIPSRILELMGVQCLTRHNIASHLQKYRSHRRHLIAREAEAATWNHRRPTDPTTFVRTRRDGTPWMSNTGPLPIQPRPVPVPLAPLHSSTTHGQPPVLPRPYPHPVLPMPPQQPVPIAPSPMHVWGHPTVDHSAGHMWQQPSMVQPTMWHAGGAMWQHPSMAHGTWAAPPPGPGWGHGHPQMVHPMQPPAGGQSCSPDGTASAPAVGTPAVVPVTGMDCYYADGSMAGFGMLSDDHPDLASAAAAAVSHRPPEISPPKEILDAAISEALSNPFTPLPLGLKPPSMEGVMAELQKRGEADMDATWV